MRPFTVIECDQKTPEWFAARCGRVTGSVADAILAKGRGDKPAADRVNLRIKLALERVTGVASVSRVNTYAMQQGTEREPVARLEYEAQTGVLVTQTGFLRHDALMIGCSLDGHVGEFEGAISLKCPDKQAIHWDYLQGNIPDEYLRQIWHEQVVAPSLQWTDFVSFCPEFPEGLRLHIKRVPRDEAALKVYSDALAVFLAEVDQLEAEIRARAECAA